MQYSALTLIIYSTQLHTVYTVVYTRITTVAVPREPGEKSENLKISRLGFPLRGLSALMPWDYFSNVLVHRSSFYYPYPFTPHFAATEKNSQVRGFGILAFLFVVLGLFFKFFKKRHPIALLGFYGCACFSWEVPLRSS